MPRTLHLIKHGKPALVPGVPAHEWELAPAALHRLPALLDRLNPRPDIIICSQEPKAQATAEALAAALDVPCRPMLGLHEQLRYSNPVLSDEQFQARMADFFARPAELVLGEESAADALTRFRNAVRAAMRVNEGQTVAIVAHGTVISLLVAELTRPAGKQDAHTLWRELGLLEALTVEWPES